MADYDEEIGGSSVRKRRWYEIVSGIFAQAVSMATLLYGEDATNNRLKVEAQPADADSVLETLQNGATGAGTGTAINVKGYKSVTFRVNGTSGTWNGGFQATMDDTNWYYIQVTPLDTGTAVNGSATQFNPSATTVDNVYTIANLPVAISQIRFNIVSRTSGTINVTSRKFAR